jgi:threonine dehydrogenase-like Zn-dependent dehydrogenase
MRAIVLDYERRALEDRDVPAPDHVAAGEVLFRVEEAGVCGTDRELASFRFGYPPQGEPYLILGHEAAGTVVSIGSEVKGIVPGDLVAPMIRRGCAPPCACCARRRADLCLTGRYRERGLFGLHGYLTAMAVDCQEDLAVVPRALASLAVLAEPLSVVEKAVSTAIRLRQEPARNALILGAGPIGLLAAMVLRLRGLEVALYSLEAADHPRARLAEQAGAQYLTTLSGFQADIVLEATGSTQAAFSAIACLGPLGVGALLGAGSGAGNLSFLDLVVNNQVVFGSVNAGPDDFRAAVGDLGRFDPLAAGKLIHRVPFSQYRETITGPISGTVKWVHVLH